MKQDIKNYTLQDLNKRFMGENLPKFYACQVFSWLYEKRIEDFDKMTNISKDARELLKSKFYFSNLNLLKKEVSCDGTEKFLFSLSDDYKIESVLIPESSRLTLCLSTQVGCKFKCNFCLSGQKGFKRNLDTCEIINQYLFISDVVLPKKITNIVFMGIGEPLDNFTNTINAVKIFMDTRGLSLGRLRICISTCGLIPEIKRLAQLKLGIKLSVSLHSANDDTRTKLMPINKRYPLVELMKAVKEFARYERYPVTFEYALLSALNTSKKDAVELAYLLKHIHCKVNLIPYNHSCLKFKAPSPEEIQDFSQILKEKGIFFTLRKARGEDINAACGQLRALWD
ncbi:MAG: 23S rRNA (adenine(2503)-C(2))-methyltransferase RlmN [Candidatus Omnitrophota bacterium]|nr:23S rRNA (adenine(2503)-C(2))-methyltransferase RlmN [Candidatus Omnitrophota bacterium]